VSAVSITAGGSDLPEWALYGLAVLARAVARRGEGETEQHAAAVRAGQTALHEALQGHGPFAVLTANARLAAIEAETLAVLATAETHPVAQRLLVSLQGEAAAHRVSLGTLFDVVDVAHVGELGVGPDGALRRAALVEIGEVAEVPWLDQRIGLHSTVVWSLLGDPGRDPGLPADARTVDSEADGTAGIAVVTGADPGRRRQCAADTLVGSAFLVAPLPDSDTAWSALVREATLTGQGVIVELDDTLPSSGRRWIERADHLAWGLVCGRDVPIAELPERPWTPVHVPDQPVSDEEWEARLGDAPRVHRLNVEQLDLVARAHDAYDGDLDAAVRRLVSGRLEQVTRRIRPRYGWDDLVLSPERKAALHAVADRYRNATQVYDSWGFRPAPSRGTVALFSGPSGTGKSMAAEVVAGALHLDLFKLDLSAIVSKYIGETEKNLEQVFEAAGTGNLLLFFDEADALFGKRSEVRDARDRYANVETSYLLQRLEVYDGLVVMATNFEKNIDEAFLRRIHTRIEFTLPGAGERRAIWDSNLPAAAPVEGVDTAWLAERFELSGGQIRNAAVRAGFLAAANDTPVTMECAVRAVAQELRKQGRLLKPSEFGEYADLI
jgi:AAA+ superfamily predicted ATPase